MKMTVSENRPFSNKLIAASIFFLFLLLTISPLVSCQASFFEESSSETHTSITMSTDTQELDLLRVEHYLYVNASADVGTFHIRFSFPPDYEYQVPLLLEMYNDSTTIEILHYQIENDTYEPNKIINFTIGSMKKGDSVLLHFSCWVLVKNHDFSDLPVYVKIPKTYQLPDETKIWLVSNSMVQTHSVLLRYKARELHGLSDNLIRYARRIAPFLRYHHYFLFAFELHAGLLLSQDARTTLLLSGENVGRAHMACAFFRIYHVPARVLLVNNDQGFWTQMHYMAEYYCPGYGWVLMETTFGKSPYATKHQVINRVCYPQDEKNTKEDYIFHLMKGEERWLWIDTNSVSPYYVDCKKGSKAQMFNEAVVSPDQLTANFAFVLTERVFREYQSYLGVHLTGQNLYHFQNATLYQKNAISSLKGNNTEGYISFLNRAYDEYKEIGP
jgi:hypothetical protein